MPVQVSYLNQFLIILIFLVVVFSGIEVGARAFDFFDSKPRCNMMVNEAAKDLDYFTKRKICDNWENILWIRDPITSLKTLETNQHTPIMNINSDGFRGPEISKEKPDNTYRIFVVGGSTTFAIRSISDQTTIPGYLQENFDKLELSKNIEVINAGVPGFKAIDELRLVKTKLIDYSPDLIIIYDGFNDVTYQDFKSKIIKQDVKYDTLEYYYKKYFWFYRTPAVLDKILENDVFKVKPTIQAPMDIENVPGLKSSHWYNNINEICDLGKQNGWDTLMILQPWILTGNKTLSETEMKLYNKEANPRLGYFEEYKLMLEKLDKLESSCAQTANLWHIFDSFEQTVYFDSAHISHKNNKIVADEIFKLAVPIVT